MAPNVMVGLVITLPSGEGYTTYYCYIDEPVAADLLRQHPEVRLRFQDDESGDYWSHNFDMEIGNSYWQTPENTKSLVLMVPLKLDFSADQQEKLRAALDADDDWSIDE